MLTWESDSRTASDSRTSENGDSGLSVSGGLCCPLTQGKGEIPPRKEKRLELPEDGVFFLDDGRSSKDSKSKTPEDGELASGSMHPSVTPATYPSGEGTRLVRVLLRFTFREGWAFRSEVLSRSSST
jgi:hypothetical protein